MDLIRRSIPYQNYQVILNKISIASKMVKKIKDNGKISHFNYLNKVMRNTTDQANK